MNIQYIWQQDSNNPENTDNFAAIAQWWASLNGKEIQWQQRLIPPNGEVSQINWEPQRFDEVFPISQTQIRGITLYWNKPEDRDKSVREPAIGDRSTTPHKLELDPLQQILYIYPQSQREVIVRVELPDIKYQTIELHDPDLAIGKKILLLRDKQQQLEIKVTLSPDNLNRLKQMLP